MSRHLECVFIHVVFGVLLFVTGIVDLLLNFGDFFIGVRSFVIFCGAWMYITGGILAINRKRTSCRRKGLAGAFITSSLCGMTVGACYSFLILYFCEFSCGPENAVAVIVCILSIVQCIAGCSSCYCVAFSSSQADQILSPANVPAGDAQMVPTCMPPRSAFQNNDRPPPYGDGSPGPDLLLVPLEGTPMSLQSVVQQNDRPPPYTVDAQTCSHGSDLLLVPLEMTPMPPQETGPPPPYHQISTTESVMSSVHDGHQLPPYVRTDEQMCMTGGILARVCKRTSCGRNDLADQSFSPFTVPSGNAQMVPTCMPPRSVLQDNDRPPPYGAGSPGPDLLLVQLEITPMSLQSIFQQNDRPPPYTVDAQTCSRGSDLLLVPLEMTPMPPQETGPPPPYHQISTTESVMSSFHGGDLPPAYVCTDEQHRVTTYV